jgi:hypothetical protein
MSFYHTLIAETLAARGIHEDPDLIEALMRLDPRDGFCSTRTLDGLSRDTLQREALFCASMVTDDRGLAVELAETNGYRRPRVTTTASHPGPVTGTDVPATAGGTAPPATRERCPMCGGLNPGDVTHTRCAPTGYEGIASHG